LFYKSEQKNCIKKICTSEDEILFFKTLSLGGDLNNGTYSLYLSTTSKAVNGLDLINFDNNLGGDNQLFTTQILAGGPAPGTLSFTGSSFTYDPSLGNLLLDIQIAGISHIGLVTGYDAMIDSGGLFSRAHDFDSGFENRGLVTEFRSIPDAPTLFLLGSACLMGFSGFRRKSRK